MARGQSHGLGMGKGSIIDQGGGIVEYRQTGKLMPAFKVSVADVTGFSVRKATKQDRKNGASALQQVIVLQGGGTELASCAVNHGTAEKIEAGYGRVLRLAATPLRTLQCLKSLARSTSLTNS